MDKSIEQMERDLARAAYRASTRAAYLRTVSILGSHFGRPVAELGRDEIRTYIDHLQGQGRSASWLKMKLSAIVFLFAKTLGRQPDVSFIVWPRQYSPLPTVLSQDEVVALFDAIRHPVYHAVAVVQYGTGCGSAKRSRSRSRTSTALAACSASVTARATGRGR